MLSVTERSTGRLFGVCWCAQQHWGHEKSKMRHWEDARQETLVCAQTASCFSLHCVQFSHEKLPKLLRDRRSWTALRCDEPRARLVIVNQRRDAKRMGGAPAPVSATLWKRTRWITAHGPMFTRDKRPDGTSAAARVTEDCCVQTDCRAAAWDALTQPLHGTFRILSRSECVMNSQLRSAGLLRSVKTARLMLNTIQTGLTNRSRPVGAPPTLILSFSRSCLCVGTSSPFYLHHDDGINIVMHRVTATARGICHSQLITSAPHLCPTCKCTECCERTESFLKYKQVVNLHFK